MYVRALIVVLIVLNAGVALWWAMQPPPAPPAAPAQPSGVARLEIVPQSARSAPGTGGQPRAGETGDAAASGASAEGQAPAAAAAATAEDSSATARDAALPERGSSATGVAAAATAPETAVPVPPAASERCVSLGSYATRADAEAALARIRGQVGRSSVREDTDAGVSTFRVMLPNVGDRAAAQALVKRIAAAGIGDYYVIAQGEDNTVALGQYQSRERAERRQASLVSAGFPAQLVPSGNGQSRWWIDVRSKVAAAALQGTAGATRQRSLDCAALR
ncbi:SPOR domain-containing protein [Xanthomonas melonis]|uniref:SPOR domain-containing protein n=1 Tax=Xanthomonas melonis TaxID=56456 RepID=A0ABS8NRP4_9XANT|nr:SPOR domain-containing protein [Xanthomonas melonis]MCD0245526.1 SPOR domain-containing protein [Xanthomonas melonis]MCD0257519.1 SPOR domain-containing protein [Xanthomonas melonis]MCD0265739.1 SPOR domain-containing protein [Xanthomonas melonis]